MEKWFLHNILSLLIPIAILTVSISEDWLIPTAVSLSIIIILEIVWVSQINKYYKGE